MAGHEITILREDDVNRKGRHRRWYWADCACGWGSGVSLRRRRAEDRGKVHVMEQVGTYV